MKKTAAIAMSGGVDSSVASFLLKEAGYECTGITMKLLTGIQKKLSADADYVNAADKSGDVEDARKVAERFGFPFYALDFSDRFEECVVRRFIQAYEDGCTPNPCVSCNRFLKFGELYQAAKELGCDYVATGHYARIEKDEATGRWLLKKAADLTKDQSYVLYSLSQDQLAHTLFPLGGLTKTEARAIAEAQGLVNAHKHDSQDICFIPDGKYAEFIEGYTGRTFPEGSFVDAEGTVMGTHRGIIRYTIGQRKGLGLAVPEPVYVCRLDMEHNNVILGKNEDLFSKTLIANDINLISIPEITRPIRAKAKVRYRQKEQWATITPEGADSFRVEFDEPQRAITKGQAVVLYDEDTVVGGGTIAAVCS